MEYNFHMESSYKMYSVENSLENEDYSIMCKLPDKILTRIFTKLHLQDRKSVKRTCKQWNKCATDWSIRKNEVFVFQTQNCHKIEDVARVIQNFEFSNLKFQGLSMISLPVSFWKECGPHIASLKFFHCNWNDNIMENIILNCENLTSLVIESRDTSEYQILLSPQFLDKLVENGIQRTELRNFEFINESSEKAIVLDNIFHVYPHMSHFTAAGIYPDSDVFNFPPTLEHVSFLGGQAEHFIGKCISKGLRLRCFEANLKINQHEELQPLVEILWNFFSLQENLNVVNLNFNTFNNFSSEPFLTNLTFYILQKCPNLQELHIDSDSLYLFTGEQLTQFFSLIAKLQCLSICLDPIIALYEMSLMQFPKNIALTTLDLWIAPDNEICDQIYAALLPNCPSLRHLKLRVNSDYLLQIIFKYLLNLLTLMLDVGTDCTDFGFTGQDAFRGEGYSIKRLQRLEHLRIFHFSQVEFSFIGKIIPEFQLPCLEVLELDIELEMVSEEALIHLPSQVPKLRVLMITTLKTTDLFNLMKLCLRLKKLDHLLIKFGVVHDIAEIFVLCPSLRYITVNSNFLSRNGSKNNLFWIEKKFFVFQKNIFSKYNLRTTSDSNDNSEICDFNRRWYLPL